MSNLEPETPHGIAIVGLAGRFPGSPTLESFWDNLRAGKECITTFSEDELLAAGVSPAELADPRYVRARGTLAGVELFDPGFFGFTPREAELLDPQHRLFLETAWLALENAGCDPDRFAGRAAVFGGSGSGTYLLHNLLPNRELLEKVGVLQAMLMNEGDFLTTRVSYKLNLKGPSVLVQTACSTSLVAIHLACQSLLAGESDLALAGGVSIDTPQTAGYFYQESSVMSPDGHCRAFDERAAGTVNGSGVGVVVLKRLADALADGDTVHAVILGSAVNNDGSAKVGFTAPSVEGQSEAVAEALLMAGVEPDTIGYVEAHGSGTQLGDPIEVAALTQAYRGATDRTGFCALGSVKTNLGHCNAAAGVAGLFKTVLSLQHGEIPASLGFERPNPQIDFAASPFFVNTQLAPWPDLDAPKRAGVSSFGLGGTNAHIVLEEPRARETSEAPSRAAQLLVISARTPTALDTATANLAEHLRGLAVDDGSGLADVAWTLQTGRRVFEHRRIAVARTPAEAAAALADPKRAISGSSRREGDKGERPMVFLFPGLGDQYPDMARGLYASEPLFREIVDECADRLSAELGLDLREVLFSDDAPARPAGAQGPDLRALLRRNVEANNPAAARLAETAVAHPAVFVVEYALARLLMSWGIRPEAMIGYSIGEYVAACLSGVLSLEHALQVVARRAKLIQELPEGAMLAVPLGESEVRPLLSSLEDRISVAATNGPHFCVVGGPREALEELSGRLAERGASCIFLQTTHAFHSLMMEPAMGRFGEVLRGVEMGTPEIPYLSNVTGTWITADDLADPEYWARHMRGTVRFAEGLSELLGQPNRIYLEVGPGATLGTLVKQHEAAPAGAVTVATLRRGSEERDDVEALLEAAGRLWTAGAALDWAELHGGDRRLRVPLPGYPFERTRCWIDPPLRAEAAHRMAELPPAEPGASPGATHREDVGEWFWVPAWRQAAPPLGGTAAPGSWLLFVDSAGFGERVAARLRQAGQQVATVSLGTDFAETGDGAFSVDPGQRAHYDSLVQQLKGRAEGLPTHVLHLWGATAEEPSYDEAQRAGLLSLMFLEQALTQAAGGSEGPAIRIGVVTAGACEVVDGDRVVPARATVLGACKVIHQESRQLTCSSLDVALPAPGSPSEERLIGQLLAEMEVPELEPAVAYRGRQRWVRTFDTVRVPEEPGVSRLRPDGAYLMTDGVHAVGLGMAEALAGLGARIAVLLPPDFPAREKWAEIRDVPAAPPGQDLAGAAVRRLLPLEERGAVVVRADVADPASLANALTEARSRLGGLDGVLHTSAPFTGGLIQLKTPESLETALRPVARGAEALFAALGQTGIKPDFVLLTGSTLAFSGGLGQLDIAAAGCYLDALAQQRMSEAGEDGPYTVVAHWDPYQWSGWLAAGTAAISGLQPGQLAQELESFGTPPARSVEALRRLLATPLQRAVVTARDLHALIAETDAFTIEAFMAQMQKAHADQEARGRTGIPTPYVEPTSDLERQVAAIWEELFGIRPIGIEDNFLELGGHSLLAIQMATQLRNAFGVDLPVTVLFEAPTVGALAAAIAREQGGGEDPDELERLLALVEGLSPEEALKKMEEMGLSPEEVLQ
jgi:acyl transferase domain-containing protein/acyl carrier protein